jgi:hypothetical protein
MEVSGQLHALVALTPGKNPPYLRNRRLGGRQSHIGSFGEEEDPYGRLCYRLYGRLPNRKYRVLVLSDTSLCGPNNPVNSPSRLPDKIITLYSEKDTEEFINNQQMH